MDNRCRPRLGTVPAQGHIYHPRESGDLFKKSARPQEIPD